MTPAQARALLQLIRDLLILLIAEILCQVWHYHYERNQP